MNEVYKFLEEQKIPFTKYEHPAVFTIEQAETLCINVPGKQPKNLFLTNKKGDKHFLITLEHSKKADLVQLAKFINEKGLRFASPERLQKYLGLTPGSVSPMGLINDINKKVTFILDSDLLNAENIYIHPNINTATIGLSIENFKNLISNLGYTILTYKA